MAILDNILLAREQRYKLRNNISDSRHASISLTLNIPGYPKSSDLIHNFFLQILSELKTYLKAHRIHILEENEICITDDDGDFYLSILHSSSKSVKEIKTISENFEETHTVGRLIDVDVVDERGGVISSGKTKSCYYCGEHAAISCMRDKRHSLTELRNYVFDSITRYLNNFRCTDICKKLAGLATRAILYEISLTPKPGLVDTADSGVHSDMDYFTFLNTSSVISPYFFELAQKGYLFNGNITEILPTIRNIGLQMEVNMFKASNGVNTQKGIIFFIGLSLFITAQVIAKGNNFNKSLFQNILMQASAELDSEFSGNMQPATHGEKCNAKFGNFIGGGARAEAQSGFSTVFNSGLPELEKYNLLSISNKSEIEIALRNTLLSIISTCNDSTILYRSSPEVLKEFQFLATEALGNKANNDDYLKLIDYCRQNNISPGGSADLLAITVFIHFVQNTNFHFQ